MGQPARAPSWLRPVREFFLLESAAERASRIEPELRTRHREGLWRALRQRDAAEVLWAEGEPEAALELLRTASRDAHLVARETAPDAVAEAAPAADAEFTSLLKAHATFHCLAVPLVMSDEERVTIAQRRRAVCGSLVFLVLAVSIYWVRRPPQINVEATASYSMKYDAVNAIDGKEHTEWLLPDRQQGTLDLTLSPARSVKTLRLLNAHNPPANDRATIDYQVEVVTAGRPARIIDGTFGSFNAAPEWQSVNIAGKGNVEHIRITVRSWFNYGGGLAEVAVE